MTKGRVECKDAAEALFLEQALAMYREMREVAGSAPDGEVLHEAELFAVNGGRELIRKGLEGVLQEQAEEVEKRGAGPRMCLRRSSRTSRRKGEIGHDVGGSRKAPAYLLRVPVVPSGCLPLRPSFGC